MDTQTNQTETGSAQSNTKFCKHCGGKIPTDAVLCTLCGRQVEDISGKQAQPNIIINNSNANANTNTNVNTNVGGINRSRPKNKWVALCLCILFGYFGAHKFYEEKTGLGILYLFTCGLFGFGWIIDMIALIFKPNPYYV